MSLLRNIASGLRSLFRRDQVDRELDDELRAYQEMAAEEKMKQGMNRKDALRAVRLERGSLEVSKEIVRSGGWESFVETCWQDLRHGLRGLRKNLGVTTIVVLTLALGVGANTAIFGLVNGILLQRLPVSQPEQIVALVIQPSGSALGALGFSYPQLVEFRQQTAPFCEVFGQALGRVNLTVDAHADLVACAAQ